MAKPQSFKKGKDPRRNLKGAPKKEWTWAGTLKRIAEEEQANGVELKELMGKALIREGLKGNVPAIKEFGDRIDGKAPISVGRFDEDGEFKEQNIGIKFV